MEINTFLAPISKIIVKKMVYICVTGGLSNRLRTIIGFWFLCEKRREKCVVDWVLNDDMCGGDWKEMFDEESLLSEAFLEMRSINFEHQRKNYDFGGHSTIACTLFRFGRDILPIHLRHDETTIDKIWSSSFCRDIEDEFYGRLPIRKDIKERVLKYLEKEMTTPFVAVHVRRTDHQDLAKKHGVFTSDEEFASFIEKHRSKDIPVYLATDEFEVQKSFVKLGCRVYKMMDECSRSSPVRQTKLEHALIDILIAGHSEKFMGSGFSSFSKLIDIVRRNIHVVMGEMGDDEKKNKKYSIALKEKKNVLLIKI